MPVILNWMYTFERADLTLEILEADSIPKNVNLNKIDALSVEQWSEFKIHMPPV